MKKVIINADDFGYTSNINKGILKAINNGVVSSTSIMVDGKAVDDVAKLKDLDQISIGLHFCMDAGANNFQEEFNRQIEKFIRLVGRKPDHIDVHKPRSLNFDLILPILKKYSDENNTPVRELGHANTIKDFFGINVKNDKNIDINRISVQNLLHILGNLEEGVSEIMTHAGYSDDELRSMSSYSDMRETELKTLTDKRVIGYFENRPDLELVSWRNMK